MSAGCAVARTEEELRSESRKKRCANAGSTRVRGEWQQCRRAARKDARRREQRKDSITEWVNDDKKDTDATAGSAYGYEPDYAVSPGEILDERLEARGLSQSELANRCGLPSSLISKIIACKASVEPRIALQFERVLGDGRRHLAGH